MKRRPTRSTGLSARRRRAANSGRLNGLERWPNTLDQFLWMLLRAGIEPTKIVAQTARILKSHHKVRPLSIPPPEVLEYSRVLTYWRNEPKFLDADGKARALPLKGRGASFAALVRLALPEARMENVLAVLKRHQLVGFRGNRVSLKSIAFIPKNTQRAQFFAYTLAAVSGIIDTGFRNLTSRRPKDNVGRLQRVATAERFDLKHVDDFNRFVLDLSDADLPKVDAWLKLREAKGSVPSDRIAQVGIGIFAFRAR